MVARQGVVMAFCYGMMALRSRPAPRPTSTLQDLAWVRVPAAILNLRSIFHCAVAGGAQFGSWHHVRLRQSDGK
jgi:hypothetical protein